MCELKVHVCRVIRCQVVYAAVLARLASTDVGTSYLTLPTPLYLKATPLNPPCDQVTFGLTSQVTRYNLRLQQYHDVVVVTGTLAHATLDCSESLGDRHFSY